MAGKNILRSKVKQSFVSGNVINKSIETGSLIKDNEKVTLGVAVETEKWNRPTEIAQKQALSFMRAVEKTKAQLAKGTRSAVQREALHRSLSDIRKHYTVVCFDEFGKYLRTVHLPLADDEEIGEVEKDEKIERNKKGEKGKKDTKK